MDVIADIPSIRTQVQQWQNQDQKIALVPTMGHLHAGHLSLVELAKSSAQRVVVTIFINPLQFDQIDDLARYPRTLSSDIEQLKRFDVDAVFAPKDHDLYPLGIESAPRIKIPVLSDEFCGQFRPGHFEGVCTIVAKLFNLIRPHCAIFGKKDYQQLLIIKRMVKELNFFIDIVAGETVREPDGLALSSRNILLNQEERRIAPQLYQTLRQISENFTPEKILELESSARNKLENIGMHTEYFAVRNADNLAKIDHNTNNYVVLAAVWLGTTRLIDNILFQHV